MKHPLYKGACSFFFLGYLPKFPGTWGTLGGVAVYLVAPLEMRIEHVRRFRDCSASEARKYVKETDDGRRDFIRTYFNRDMGDPHQYDLVINRARVDEEAAAELIISQFRRRFGS